MRYTRCDVGPVPAFYALRPRSMVPVHGVIGIPFSLVAWIPSRRRTCFVNKVARSGRPSKLLRCQHQCSLQALLPSAELRYGLLRYTCDMNAVADSELY
ncbi:hypothetical protein BDW22DRAFT_6219 [Trametopsis cervina]|nr:hypothetical protein BDW22DRAFT_6219 [Trametopsis cervina]